MWNNDKVKITPVEEMEGFEVNNLPAGFHYFEDRTEMFVAPTTLEKLKTGEIKEISYMMFSWERPGRNINEDIQTIIRLFKKQPHGKEPQFDVEERLKEYNEQLTKEKRIIVSPFFDENV